MSDLKKFERPVSTRERLDKAVNARVGAAHDLLALLASRGISDRPHALNSNLVARSLSFLAALGEEERACREADLEADLAKIGMGGMLEKLPPESRP